MNPTTGFMRGGVRGAGHAVGAVGKWSLKNTFTLFLGLFHFVNLQKLIKIL